jgi:hypothetical protein
MSQAKFSWGKNRENGSLASQDLSPNQKAKANKNRKDFEADQRSIETWAASGFGPGAEIFPENRASFDDEDVIGSEEDE